MGHVDFRIMQLGLNVDVQAIAELHFGREVNGEVHARRFA